MNIEDTIDILRKKGIRAFELSGILVIPVSPKDTPKLDQIAKNIKRIFEEIGYDKSWCLNPYHEDKTIEKEMYRNDAYKE